MSRNQIQLPGWYERYFEWSRSKGALATFLPAAFGPLFGVAVAYLILSSSGADGLLRLLGWSVLIGGLLAALESWAAGIYRGHRTTSWVRLFAISGVGVGAGLLIMLNI